MHPQYTCYITLELAATLVERGRGKASALHTLQRDWVLCRWIICFTFRVDVKVINGFRGITPVNDAAVGVFELWAFRYRNGRPKWKGNCLKLREWAREVMHFW